ncbi:DUF4179 domain-containing protein [Paenibacillaceae bacterium]|nr:DUF4179 domain-containing protein [Paenibacillaceae bacterium]
MNEHWEDKELIHKLQQRSEAVPPAISLRVDETLASLRRKPRFLRKAVYSGAAACIIFIGIAGANIVSPHMVQALKNVPVLGSAFEMIGDVGLQLSSRMGLASKVNETATDQGITMTITEVLYDGIRLSIGYIIETSHDLRPDGEILFVNGKKVGFSSGGSGLPVNDQLYTGVLSYELRDTPLDHFNLILQFDHMVDWGIADQPQQIQGIWRFNLPVAKLKEGIRVHTFDQPPTARHLNKTIRVNKVTLTPAVTAIELDEFESVTSEHNNAAQGDGLELLQQLQTESYQVFDDKGLLLQNLGDSGHGTTRDGDKEHLTKRRISLAPLSSPPEYLLIRPVIHSRQVGTDKGFTYIEDTMDVTKLPLTLSQGKAGQVTITNIEFREDQTLLQFRVEGDDPYRQAGSVWLTDQHGKPFMRSIVDLVAVKGEPYTFSQKFPPIDSQQLLKVKTIAIDPPEIVSELELRIPLNDQ